MLFGMNNEKQKRISVYLKAGDRAATSYYRFYQYFRKVDADIKYHLMIPDSKWNSFFPIAQQPKWKQVYIFFLIYFRVLGNLLTDIVKNPDCVVVSRCIINKVLPWSYKFLLKQIKRKGARIIWDFDDNIIGREMTRKNFDWFSYVADIIIVGSPVLKEMVCEGDRDKVIMLPTTDGDMHHLLTEDIKEERWKSFEKTLKVIWVGTFSSLEYVERVTESFENAGRTLTSLGKKLQLTVVCDKELLYTPKNFKLINIKWDKQTAITQMLHSHVGIMPLEDDESTRGKCGFKLIQYLSIGLPVIGSTVGMNSQIINDCVGVGVTELDIREWEEAIVRFVESPATWKKYSNNAYKEWECHYDYKNIFESWKSII